MTLTIEQARPLIDWVNEREAIRIRKAILEHKGDEKLCLAPAMQEAWGITKWGPGGMGWRLDYLTHDPILREHRFCNVQREHDRVTIWIRENIREPFADHPNLWFATAIARYINWPDAVQELLDNPSAWPYDERLFRPEYMTAVLDARHARGEKCETGAFMTRAPSSPKEPWFGWSKRRYVAEIVLGKLWTVKHDWEAILQPGQTLEATWTALQDPYYTGWGPFAAGQFVVDLRWTRYLKDAPDIDKWTALGPGSRKGLNYLHGRDPETSLSQEKGLVEMLELRELLKQPGVLAPWVEVPSLSDTQNCLCETSKYLRAKQGGARLRAKYVPGRGW